jgi:hypothetical protein
MLGAIEDQQRVRPQDRLHERVRLASTQIGLIAGKQLPDRVGIDDVDAGSKAGHPDRKGLAIARVPCA